MGPGFSNIKKLINFLWRSTFIKDLSVENREMRVKLRTLLHT